MVRSLASAVAVALLLAAHVCSAEEQEAGTEAADDSAAGRVLPIFNVVQFGNDQCLASNSNNGTCYTSSECSNKGGSSSGTCASGFGVCCVFTLSCGGSSSENNTYIYQASVTTLTSPCSYTICKCSSDICRIRFDMATFTLSGVAVATALAANQPVVTGAQLGDCPVDTFSISGTPGSPLICGANKASHMIVDATDDCHVASFYIGASTSTSRTWHMHVTQYTCGQESIWGGPPGCTQYFTGTTGTIKTYAFPTGTAITAAVTHLTNQQQTICIRRTTAYCYICYVPTITIAAPAVAVGTQSSFGVSVSQAAPAAKGSIGTLCQDDYVEIPGATTLTIASSTTNSITLAAIAYNRICGRYFNTASAQIANNSVCTRAYPYTVTFVSDNNEITTSITGTTNEMAFVPTGTIGFSLNYVQTAC